MGNPPPPAGTSNLSLIGPNPHPCIPRYIPAQSDAITVK